MLLDSSEEFGIHEGLGIIPGKVVRIETTNSAGNKHKVPHVAWSPLVPSDGCSGWDNTILEGIKPASCAYFVHSYTPVPADKRYRLADSLYNGRLISAVIKKANVYGCQFHPEKSGGVGLKIIKNFLNL